MHEWKKIDVLFYTYKGKAEAGVQQGGEDSAEPERPPLPCRGARSCLFLLLENEKTRFKSKIHSTNPQSAALICQKLVKTRFRQEGWKDSD